MTRSLGSMAVILAFSTVLAAQSDCTLVVHVLTLDQRSIQAPIQVEVLSPEGFVVASTSTTGGEPAQVHVGSGKTYILKVSGAGIEAVTTSSFGIHALESNHTETVHVKPDTRNQPGESEAGSPISVGELSIPEKASAEMEKGLDAYLKGDFEKAAVHFKNAAARYPRYARAYDMLGVISIKDSDRGNARELFLKSIQVDDTFFPAYVDLARMNLQDGRYADSESLLEKAIALKPSMPDALALLATTEFANKEYDKALADVQRTHALPNHEQFAEVHLMAARVLNMQDHPQAAIVQYQLFLKEKPASPEAQTARKALASLEARQQP